MKVAVVGKGGVGKTTVSAALALSLAERGEGVFAVDADPNNCLGYALGFPAETVEQLQPLSDMRELLAERAGTADGGPVYALAPPVMDVIGEYQVTRGDLSFLVMGSVIQGGGGCACPENATLKALLREMVGLEQHVIVDLEAGLEHLGRGTARALEVLLAVTPPTATGLRTVQRIAKLARDVGLDDVRVLGNMVATEEEAALVREGAGELPVVGCLGRYEGLSSDDVFGNEAGERLRGDVQPIVEALR